MRPPRPGVAQAERLPSTRFFRSSVMYLSMDSLVTHVNRCTYIRQYGGLRTITTPRICRAVPVRVSAGSRSTGRSRSDRAQNVWRVFESPHMYACAIVGCLEGFARWPVTPPTGCEQRRRSSLADTNLSTSHASTSHARDVAEVTPVDSRNRFTPPLHTVESHRRITRGVPWN